MIDWRGCICDLLHLSEDSTDEVILEGLAEAAEQLEDAARAMNDASETQVFMPRYELIHRVRCADTREYNLFLETPWVVDSGPEHSHLRGSRPVGNLELYLEKNKDISFIAYKDYTCCVSSQRHRGFGDPAITDPSTLLTRESVYIVSEEFCSALITLVGESPPDEIFYPTFEVDQEFSSPYLWWFHRRKEFEQTIRILEPSHREHIHVFSNYLHENLGDTWHKIDSLLAEGKMEAKYIAYLYVSFWGNIRPRYNRLRPSFPRTEVSRIALNNQGPRHSALVE